MMLYLTGAETSLAKSPVASQTDVARSLGGYISSTPAPNAAVNTLFDLISSETLRNRQKETIAIALVNKLPQVVTDVKLRFISSKEDVALFKVAAVSVGEDYAMESIANRYQEPMNAEFHSATFNKAYVDINVSNPADVGEVIQLLPFDVEVEVTESGIEGTWTAFEYAFENSENYEIKRMYDNVFRIMSRGIEVSYPVECSYITDGSFNAEFLGKFENGETNVVTLIDSESELQPNAAIGLWIQRMIKPNKYASNEKLLDDYKKHIIYSTLEEIGLCISYKLVQTDAAESVIQ
jgi:hypothetical protein